MTTGEDRDQSQVYVALFDILGFRQLLKATDIDRVKNIVRNIDNLATTLTKDFESIPNPLRYRMFQDTIVIYSQSISPVELYILTLTCSGLIATNYIDGVLLRGALTKGNISIEPNLIFGEGFVQAFEMEQDQDWAGCQIDSKCLSECSDQSFIERLRNEKHVVSYPIPRKSGEVKVHDVVNWTIHLGKSLDTALEMGWKKVVKNTSKPQTWDQRRKLENLDRFLGWLYPNKESPLKRAHNRAFE